VEVATVKDVVAPAVSVTVTALPADAPSAGVAVASRRTLRPLIAARPPGTGRPSALTRADVTVTVPPGNVTVFGRAGDALVVLLDGVGGADDTGVAELVGGAELVSGAGVVGGGVGV
jgi:hypothetical protein